MSGDRRGQVICREPWERCREPAVGEREDPDIEKKIVVEGGQMPVLDSYATPVLTPFDFIIVKCNALIGEFATMLSRYIPPFFPEMVDISGAAERARTFQLLGKAKYGPPFDDEVVQWCLHAFLWVADELPKHLPARGDAASPKGLPR